VSAGATEIFFFGLACGGGRKRDREIVGFQLGENGLCAINHRQRAGGKARDWIP